MYQSEASVILPIKFDIINSLNGILKARKPIETNLAEYTDSFFYSPRWLISFQQILADEGQVAHIIGRDENGGIRGSMHLATVRTPFLKIFRPKAVTLLGTRSVVSPEHLEFAIDREVREEWFRFFDSYLRQKFNICTLAIFDSVAEDAENIEDLAQYLTRSGYRVIKQFQDRCPYLDLPNSFEALLNGFSSKKRKAIRRELRNSEPNFELVDYAAVGDIDRALDEARKLHNLSRQIKGDTGSFDRKGYIEFHRRLARSLADDGKLYFKFLITNGKPAAFLYGFLSRDRFYDYQTGYDPAYAEQRPGFLMLARVLQDLIGRGVGRFDFLRGYEPYKLYWTDTARNTYRYYILPPGLKSWIYFALLKIYRGWR
jgi:hypothetical protein